MSSSKPPPNTLPTADETELRFYEALQSGDIAVLMSLWSEEEEVSCIHPGGPREAGLQAVRESFEQVFQHGPVDVHPEQIHRLVHQDCAIHSVLERLSVVTDQGPGVAWVWATNVYIKSALGWKMVCHHASPGFIGDVPPQSVGDGPATLH